MALAADKLDLSISTDKQGLTFVTNCVGWSISVAEFAKQGNCVALAGFRRDHFDDLALAGPLMGVGVCVLESVNLRGITSERH